MAELTIVALPDDLDPVWKVSSEKVPHMTILYLGETDDQNDISEIAGYIQHTIDVGFPHFLGLVKSRGTLGSDEADVLFFDEHYLSKIVYDFRSFMLKNPTVRKLYDSVDQYPMWTPHITLGYPETPAKKLPEDSRVGMLSSVSFNRIALWTDDYDGLEFNLGSDPMVSEAAHDALQHYGVKGMKWGVRKDRKSTKSTRKTRLEDIRNTPLKEFTVTAKNGKTVNVKESPRPKIAQHIASLSDKRLETIKNYSDFNLTVDGKNVGNASINRVSDDTMNLVWLGVNENVRGQGYGGAVLASAVKHGKQAGAKRLTLEVPGNAPDARHIYEKNGFQVTKEATAKEIADDPAWGGLTHMELDLQKKRGLKHSDDIRETDELAWAMEQTFPKLPESLLRGSSTEKEHSEMKPMPSNLKHHGIGARDFTMRNRVREALPTVISKTLHTASMSRSLQHGLTQRNGESDKAFYIRQNQLIFLSHLKKSVHGTPTQLANQTYGLNSLPNGDWALSTIDVATKESTIETRVRPNFNKSGLIHGYSVPEDGISADDLRYVIRHYGVKGMKWGVRRDRQGGVKKAKKKKYTESRKDYRKRVKSETQAFQTKRFKDTVNQAANKGDDILVHTMLERDYGPTLMAGREFVDYLSKGGGVDYKQTLVVAEKTGSGSYEWIAPNEQNTMKKPKRR